MSRRIHGNKDRRNTILPDGGVHGSRPIARCAPGIDRALVMDERMHGNKEHMEVAA